MGIQRYSSNYLNAVSAYGDDMDLDPASNESATVGAPVFEWRGHMKTEAASRRQLMLREDDSPQIAFGSRHHLREEALHKRRSHSPIGSLELVQAVPGGRKCEGHPVRLQAVQSERISAKGSFTLKVAKQIFASLHLYRWAFDIEASQLHSNFQFDVG
eukprot:Skav202794  [mRNA]  locus=scaffold326:637847:639691:+ [translate_table: standard]